MTPMRPRGVVQREGNREKDGKFPGIEEHGS
jgi:hypothetical protein